MPRTDPKPIVETPPHGEGRLEVNERALRLRIRQQELLAHFGVRALKGIPFTELLEEAVHISAEGLNAELCKVLEFIPAENQMVMRAGVGWDEGLVGTARLPADLASPSGFALRTGKPVISNHLQNEERFDTPALLAVHGVRRAINVILQGDGLPYGVLEADSRSEGEFSEDDIAFLQGVANILGMAIERQRHERALQGVVEYQKVLVKEINHRVKNSLQLVASILNLQAKADPKIAPRLQEASSRIMAIGRVHERLYRSPEVEKVELAGYLSDVCHDLRKLTSNCQISFDASEPLFLNTDQAVNLALVVSELVTNAAKNAYPNDTCGQIWVRLACIEGKFARVSVRDEGVGLPTTFETDSRIGLGMRLTNALAKQSGTTLRVERPARGAEFILEIPIRDSGSATLRDSAND
jgi:two-component sensor histidine kinase